MRGVFDDREVQQAQPKPDKELTLSSTALLLIFFGLVLLCGLCFGLGYATGHHGSQDLAAAPQAAGAGQTAPQANTAQSKPLAEPPATASAAPQAGAPDPLDTSLADAGAQGAAGGSSNESPQVKPALGATPIPAPAAALSPSAVEPALPPAGSMMVQIAAVSNPEDADVLGSALRRRGYAVVSRREPLDGLIHVRIGPFKTRDEAEKWRLKLLNDGYNAIVQP